MTNTNNINERTTIIKGYIVNVEEMTRTEFEHETAYVRSVEKAAKIAREELIDDDNPLITIVVSELIQNGVEKVVYNNGKIFDYCANYFTDEESAKNAFGEYDANVYQLVPFDMYEYTCAYWAVDKDENIGYEYQTDFVFDNSPLKMTKTVMRQFLIDSASRLTGLEIIGIHNAQRFDATYYAIISNDELAKCVDA